MDGIGQRVRDIAPLLDLFEAQEGEVQHIIGKTGNGKTYEATRRALNYLESGYTVYTTWRLNLPDYYDEREKFWSVIRGFFGKRTFFRIPLRENWHYLDIDRPDLVEFVGAITDAIVFLDEGQDIFDSHDKATKAARKTITRTRHMHKTLIIVSQRAQAVDVNARANVTFFYRCVKVWSWPWVRFHVYVTDEIEEGNNYPIWVRHDSTGRETWKAPVWHRGWASRRIYASYDSWYLRQKMIRSQDLKLDAFDLTWRDRFRAFAALFRRRKKVELKPLEIEPVSPKIELSTVPIIPRKVRVKVLK